MTYALHIITVEKILDLFPKKRYPLITEKKGASPPQYPDGDEEEEFFKFGEIDETLIDKQRVHNITVLEGFQRHLEARDISRKTVSKHTTNINFYINEYLIHEEVVSPEEGIDRIGDFLGYWFIRKAMWSSVASIKENITSLKHFYTFLAQQGMVEQYELDEMKREIKECKKDWFEIMQEYDNLSTDGDDIW